MSWIKGEQAFSESMKNMWNDMASNFADNTMKMIEQMAIAALTKRGIAESEILQDASTAASNTYAQVSTWPVVGPFLAPAIAAGILAAGIGLMTGGFAEGGYTGDGGKHDVAGIVHAGEYVMPASAVDRIGVENLAALHHGSTSATSPAPGGGGHGVQVYNFTDMNQMQQHLEKNPATEKHIVDVMRRNIHKFR